MSFSRWGPGSDLYIFEHAGYDAVVCLGCDLMPEEVFESNGLFGHEVQNETFQTRDLSVMLKHIQEHRNKGAAIPADLEDTLKAGWPY